MSEVRCSTSSSPFSVHNSLQCDGLPPSFHAGQKVPEAWNIKQIIGMLCEDAHLGFYDVEQVLLLLSQRPSFLKGMQEREGFSPPSGQSYLGFHPTWVFGPGPSRQLDSEITCQTPAHLQRHFCVAVPRWRSKYPNIRSCCREKQQEMRKLLIRRCPLSPPPVLGFQSSTPGNSHFCTKKEEMLTVLRASSFSRSGFYKL